MVLEMMVAAALVVAQDGGAAAVTPAPAAPADAAAAPAADAEAVIKEAEKLLHDDDNTAANLDACIARSDAALALKPPPARAAYVHSMKALSHLRLGDLKQDKDRKQEAYKKGQLEAEKGIALDRNCAECHYMRSATLGRWGQTKGIMQALFLFDDVTNSMKTALKIRPDYLDVQLALGLVDQLVPGFAGGSKTRAEAAFRKVLAKDPHHTRAMCDLAELLEQEDRRPEAIQWAQKVLDEKEPSRKGEWRKFDKPRAERFLKEWK